MNLAQLRYFLAVAETGNFTRAAERVNVTQPTLSIGLKRLEEELGARLIERGRTARLTGAGARFLPRARAIALEWSAARAEFAAVGTTRLRLGFVRTLPSATIGRLVRDARIGLPDLSLELTDGDGPALVRLLDRGEIDAALLPLDEDDWRRHQTRSLWRERYVLALPPGHKLAGRSACRLADLAGEPFVVRLDSPGNKSLRRAMAAAGIDCPVVARLSDDERLIPLVAAGLGLAWLPDGLVPTDLATLTITDHADLRPLGLVWRRSIAAQAERLSGLLDALNGADLRLDAAH